MPYSNLHWLTTSPLGFTVALTVAAVCVNADADPVTTAGGLATVVNV